MSTPAKCILLVDDEAGLRQLLITTLAAPELTIAQAASGDRALRLARELRPDLIILDLRLNPASLGGLEVCRLVKSAPETAGSKILVLTGAAAPEDRQAALDAGADYYLTKPFSPRALLDYVYSALFD